MVRTGPVQALHKPPQLNNKVTTVLEKGFVQKTATTLPGKQALLPSKQPAFSNSKLEYGSHHKYSDLFIMPSPNPNMYVFDSSLPAYPLDTVIPSYPSARPQKTLDAGMHFAMGKTSNPELENVATKSPATELENMLKVPESDLTSLLSLFSSSSSEPQNNAIDFAIPSTSGDIFGSFPTDMFQEAPLSGQEPVDMWREEEWQQMVEGNADVKQQLLPSPPEPARDPLNCSSSLWLPPPSQTSISPPLQLTPPDSFPTPNHDTTLTTPSFSFSLPTQSTSTESTRTDRDSLSMEEQLDFLDDSLDLESLFPPAKKLQEYPPNYSEASSPVSLMHTSPISTPHPSPPPTPFTPVEQKPQIAASSSPPPSPAESAAEKVKPSPLLFGKHEDEILHKVLVPRPGLKTKLVTREKLVSMPVEEFNRLLDMASLTDIEMAFMKEWRRRGKNKTAAMVARKRKRDELSDLDVEVGQLRRQRAGLQAKHDQLQSDIATLREQTRAAEKRLFHRYSQKTGFPVSHDTHMIHVDEMGKVVMVPRLSQQMLLVK